jgi:MYXO-CTERM domain-containing protein
VTLLLALLAASLLGPHAAEQARHQGDPDAEWTWARHPLPAAQAVSKPQLAYRVYGYLPYWQTLDASFHWDLVTDLVVFAAGLRSDGTVSSWHGWPNASLIAAAHAHGVRVHLCATLFNSSAGGEVSAFLGSATAKAQAIATLADAVGKAGGDGLNFDFEFVGSGSRDLFSKFLEDAHAGLHTAAPGAELSIAAPPSLGYRGYDFARIAQSARLLVMNYDYHYGGAPTTGPVSPLTGGSTWGEVVASDTDAMLKVAPASSIVLGVPYYGYDWPAAGPDPKASTLGHGAAALYKDAVVAAQHDGPLWDAPSETPWYRYVNGSGTQHQVWYDDAQSITLKYRFLRSRSLAGAMIWALGYDSGRTELWQAIHDELGAIVVLDGGSYDGGPSDAGTHDAGSYDAGSYDGGGYDAGITDGGWTWDGGDADAGESDGGSPDPGPPDGGRPGAGDPDGGALGGPNPSGSFAGGCGTSSSSSGAAAIALIVAALALARRRRDHRD